MPLNPEHKQVSRKTVYVACAVVAIGVVVSVLPVTLGRTVNVSAKVLPAREWLLMKNQQGSLLAILCDHLRGSVESYTVVSVLRGDAFGFSMHPFQRLGEFVNAGDTVVVIRSHELGREVQRLSGALAVARADLAVMVSGEKEPVAEEAERSLVLARERSDLQKVLLARQDSLYRAKLASREEYDLAQSSAQQAAIEVAIAEARVQTVRTGAKPELVRMIRSQITALEGELDALTQQVEALTLRSPLSGVFLSPASADTLCMIEDTARVALVALPVEYVSRIAPGQRVRLRVPRRTDSVDGTIACVNGQVRNLLGRQVVMATARLNGATCPLPSHLIVVGAIETERVSLGRYLEYWVLDVWNEIVGATTGV